MVRRVVDGSSMKCFPGWLVGLAVGWLKVCLDGRLSGWFVGWFNDSLDCWLTGRLDAWVVARIVR